MFPLIRRIDFGRPSDVYKCVSFLFLIAETLVTPTYGVVIITPHFELVKFTIIFVGSYSSTLTTYTYIFSSGLNSYSVG